MTKKQAIRVLIALACCSTAQLHCSDCPLYVEERCNHLSDDDIVEAVTILEDKL